MLFEATLDLMKALKGFRCIVYDGFLGDTLSIRVFFCDYLWFELAQHSP